TITNNLFVLNGKVTGMVAAVRFTGTVAGLFRFNTVADNGAMGGTRGGVDCGANNQEIRDSIVFGNRAFNNTQFGGNFVLVKTAVGTADTTTGGLTTTNPDFETDYKLKDAAAGCCVDKASTNASTTLPFDYFGNTRPDCMGGKCDVGAHELKNL